jgi:hypothetical protein
VYLYHRCFPGGVPQVCLSISRDGGQSFAERRGSIVAPEAGHPFSVAASVARVGGRWVMVYEEGGSSSGTYWADSGDGLAWARHGALFPGAVYHATPGIYVAGDTVFVFSAAFTAPGSQTLALVFHSGTSMTNLVQWGGGFVFRGTEPWERGHVSMPRFFLAGGYHYMTYEGATLNFLCGNGSSQQNVYGWGVARSRDMINWERFAGNPIVQSTDAETCGHDMPQPFLDPVSGSVFVYYTRDDAAVVLRDRLVAGSACTASQTAPNWREKNHQCLPSCGGLGGTSCFQTKDCSQGSRVGASWDCASCCR